MSKPRECATTFFKNLRSILVGHFGLQSVSYRVETPCRIHVNHLSYFIMYFLFSAYFLKNLVETQWKEQSITNCFLKCRPCPVIQISSWFYPDFILILSWFYPDFILILYWFYPDFILVLYWIYPDFVLILSWFYHVLIATWFRPDQIG